MKSLVVIIEYNYIYLKRNTYKSWLRAMQFQYYVSSYMNFGIHTKCYYH